MRYRLSTLMIVAGGNLTLSVVLSAITVAGSTSLWPLVDCISLGQATVLGAVAALVPSGRFVGLGFIIVAAVLQAALNWLIQRWFSIQSWPMRSELYYDAYAFLVAAVLLGFRFLRGWRLTFNEPDPVRLAGQFSLTDVVEWMTCAAAILGFYTAMARAGMQLSLVDLATMLPWPVLIIVPAVPAIFSRSGPTFVAGLLLAVWSVAVCFASWMTDLRFVRFVTLLASWELSLKFSAVFLAALFGNLLILRWIGLRLNKELQNRGCQSQGEDPPAPCSVSQSAMCCS